MASNPPPFPIAHLSPDQRTKKSQNMDGDRETLKGIDAGHHRTRPVVAECGEKNQLLKNRM